MNAEINNKKIERFKREREGERKKLKEIERGKERYRETERKRD